MSKVVCVVPTIRPENHAKFVEAWKPLFEKHNVTLITVRDGENLEIWKQGYDGPNELLTVHEKTDHRYADLFYRFTDGCRNLGFVAAAPLMSSPDDVLITMDDDVAPIQYPMKELGNWSSDPIQAHIDTLSRRVPISWMNTAHDTELYLRGMPYGVRDESPVMLSHGVWVGTPDFDGETQLKLENQEFNVRDRKNGVPYSLPYFVGPIPKDVLFPLCGMNVAVKRDAIPYLYFAPMGKDTGVEGLNRFADIWMGIYLKQEFDRLNWACYTGASTVLHTRASDAKKNFEQEKLGREWNEVISDYEEGDYSHGDTFVNYFSDYKDKRKRFTQLITSIIRKEG